MKRTALLWVLALGCAGEVPDSDGGRIMNPHDARPVDAPPAPDAALEPDAAPPDGPLAPDASPLDAPLPPDARPADARPVDARPADARPVDARPVDAPAPVDAGSTETPLPGDPSDCPAGFKTQLPSGQHAGFSSAGQSRSFRLRLPSASFTGPRPLLFVWHGTGMSGTAAVSSYELDGWVDDGFIVVAPDSNGNGELWPVWDTVHLPGTPAGPNADLILFDDLIACIAGHHGVDARRVYVAGHSAGGAMANYVLGRRSSLLAGGITASGGIDLTQPVPPTPIDPMIVLVTWGGDNDRYTGSIGGQSIDNIGFVEQAALASQHWEGKPGTHQIACEGHDLGHAWLRPINGWMRDVLVAHPKGSAVVPGWNLPGTGAAPVTCGEAAATYQSPITVSCPSSTVNGCRAYCQLLGDCLAENGTIGPMLAEQLLDLGFADTPNVCSGCVTRCQADAQGSPADATVLACLATSGPATTCGPGFAGAAALYTVSACCEQGPGSNVCDRFCTTFEKNTILGGMIDACE